MRWGRSELLESTWWMGLMHGKHIHWALGKSVTSGDYLGAPPGIQKGRIPHWGVWKRGGATLGCKALKAWLQQGD